MSSPIDSTAPRPPAGVEAIVAHIAHLLPAQGPIDVFVHHNTLHAFEHLPFDAAVAEAGALLGCAPYLAEDLYRKSLREGRIEAGDLQAAVDAALDGDAAADAPLVGGLTRRALALRILVHGIPARTGPALTWALTEAGALRRFRDDLPAQALAALRGPEGGRRGDEASRVQALWGACQRAVEAAGAAPPVVEAAPVRHRDLLLQGFDLDIDEWVHPVLIRFTSAFLDQGLADQPLPGRERGLHRCFLALFRHRLTRWSEPIGGALHAVVRAEDPYAGDGLRSLEASLAALGVPPDAWQPFLLAEALALRGFAGMVRQLEQRPDRAPTTPVPARLIELLAVRLLIVRAALTHAARQIGYTGSLPALRGWLLAARPAPLPPTIEDRAWPLFQVAQLAGLAAEGVVALTAAEVARIEGALRGFDALARQRIFHQAYERRLRHRLFDALIQHPPAPRMATPDCQAIFCIDDREESIRRHLEEVDPGLETFGVAGFYGVAMYYQGITDAQPRPLCPVAIQPRHLVREIGAPEPTGLLARLARLRRRARALAERNLHVSGRRARHGAILFATIGVLWVIPLVLSVAFPWLRHRLATLYARAPAGRLGLERVAEGPAEDADAPDGTHLGFAVDEMAGIVASQLAPLGIRGRFAPLVLVFGHGSSALNNPHRSAYACGACGGGHGGPNARAFAQMANDPRVRARLAAQDLPIPDGTWFIGGERDTTSSALTLYDADRVPIALQERLARIRPVLEEARRREAHERARRFESAPLWLSSAASLAHVQARAHDLSQPRPECGHATNAGCFIGRRGATRGLFLDRRVFLVSYDGATDPGGALLAGLLGAVVPVVAGINLEYYFSRVDNAGYGAGTKLPHNLTGLFGVMDGAQSDLRTGLPWQMVEIHEPVRLAIVVEAEAALVERLIRESAALTRLVDHGWVHLAALDRARGQIVELTAGGPRPYTPEGPLPVTTGGSRPHYTGRRDDLPFAAIVPGPTTREAA